MSYLENYLQNARSGKVDPESRHSIHRDKWDKKVAANLEHEMKEYVLASKDLQGVTPTAMEAMADTVLSLFKVAPHLKSSGEMRPSYAVNRKVMDIMMGMSGYENLHMTAAGDPISAGLAAVAMEPELETLFGQLGNEVQKAAQIEQMLQDMEDAGGDAQELADALANGDLSDKEEKDYQQNLDALNEHMEQLKNQIEQQSKELDEQLGNKEHMINNALGQALSDANEQNEALQEAEGWGFDPGFLRKLDPQARIALSKKLQSDKFRKMSELFGRMQNLAFSTQMNRSTYVPEEIYDLTQGADLDRIIPTELVAASDDVMVYDWMRRFVEHSLLQYALRGDEYLNKGGIIVIEDGSSSMHGTREIWAKAIALALLKVAEMQHRSFYAIQFGGPGTIVEFDFDTTGQELLMERRHKGSVENFSGINAVLDYAEFSLSSGTDFVTPLSKALDIMSSEFDSTGAVGADIVFLTDGQAGVPTQFLDSFKAEKERLGFKVFGIAIETNPKSEPFHSICDGRVVGLQELKDPSKLEVVFREI